MRALVTGAAGFVGSYLVRSLSADGVEVFGGTPEAAPRGRGEVQWLTLDVTSADSLASVMERARPDVVFHLAAQASVGASLNDAAGTWEVNATGTLRLLAAVGTAARVLVVSSAEVYGAVPEAEQPLREARALRPCNPYAASKAAAEMLAIEASLSGRCDAVVARSFNHTGPGQDARFALPSFARQLAAIGRGEGEPVLRVGNLSARRDFLDVRDVVRAYRVLAERGVGGEVYNVCSGQARSIRSLVDEMVDISATGARVEVDPARVRPLDVPMLCGDPARLHSLGWTPEIPLERTLADLLACERQS
ncbi:MAG TPA: GDP-mannose 4,6-dehydratase [Longimicrobiaceae bacterium]|nr:GDP-mannose 4,6-dehydratase [Longimicrobiaceae bacterium]